jgi:hypothetical protein
VAHICNLVEEFNGLVSKGPVVVLALLLFKNASFIPARPVSSKHSFLVFDKSILIIIYILFSKKSYCNQWLFNFCVAALNGLFIYPFK